MSCVILQNFLMDERNPDENDDEEMLDAYAADLRCTNIADKNLEAEEDENFLEGKARLKKQMDDFVRFNKI